MGRIGCQIQFDGQAVEQRLRGGVAQVVLHVAVKTVVAVCLKFFSFKLGKYLLVRFSKDVGEYVESAPMRHAQNHFLYAALSSALEQKVQSGNQGLTALNGEALLAHEFGVQEALKRDCLVQFVQNLTLFHQTQRWGVVVLVDEFFDPIQHFRLADVHVFHPDGAAVDGIQVNNDFAQGSGAGQTYFGSGSKNGVQVLLGQPKVLQRQGGLVRAAGADGVGGRKQVAAGAVAVDQVQNLELGAHGVR